MAIGCLTYATTISRPDLAAAVGVLSKFMSKPGKEHWQGIKRVLRYIQGTLKYGLMFSTDGTSPTLTGYSDADWGGDASTRRSTTGYVFQIQGNTVTWCSKRQASVSKSTTEAEYVALSTACQEAVWLRRLLSDIGIKQWSFSREGTYLPSQGIELGIELGFELGIELGIEPGIVPESVLYS